MKKVFLLFLVLVLISGCALSKGTTKVGMKIGLVYQEAASKGKVSANKSIKAWPYISGQLKGLMASNYDLEIPPVAKEIIVALDELAKKETITDEDKGFIIGSFCRLEKIAAQEAWNRYGSDILGFFKQLAGV